MIDAITVQTVIERLNNMHLNGGPPEFRSICEEIPQKALVGDYADYYHLWDLLVRESKKIGLIGRDKAVRKAIKHVFEEKSRLAPSHEVRPALFAVRGLRRR